MSTTNKSRVLPAGYQESRAWVLSVDGVKNGAVRVRDGVLQPEDSVLVVSKADGHYRAEDLREVARVLAEDEFTRRAFKEMVVGVSLPVPNGGGTFWGLWHIKVAVTHVFTASPANREGE